MRHVWVEITKPENKSEALQWLANTKQNLVDPDVLTYPATVLLTATDGDRNLLHVPIQRAFFIESLGTSPDATPLSTAKALSGVTQIVRYESVNNGQGEIYFLCSEATTRAFAEHNGFERVDIPLYRMRVKQGLPPKEQP